MTRLLLASVAALAASPVVAQEKLTAAQVIARVKEHEAHYDDLEVRFVRRIHSPDGQPGDPKNVSSETPVRSVRQKGMARVESDSYSNGKKVASYRFRMAFDGTLTRLNWDGDRRDLPRGARHDSDLFQPHNLTVGLWMWAPLSTWLTGGPELRAHPGAQQGWDTVDVRARVAGREAVRGIDCVKLVCECYYPDRAGELQLGDTITFWLSPAHNYLPLREECVKADTPTKLLAEVVCDDLREVRRGVWLPYRTTTTRYDRFATGRVKSQVETVVVQSVTADPAHPVAFFRDAELPRD